MDDHWRIDKANRPRRQPQPTTRVLVDATWKVCGVAVACALILAVAIVAQGCTVIHAQNVAVMVDDAEVRQVDRAWVTGDAEVAHIDSVTVQGVMTFGGSTR